MAKEIQLKIRSGDIRMWIEKLKKDANYRILLALFILCGGFIIIFLVNNVLPRINTKTWHYDFAETIPVIDHVGNDFNVGYYWPAQYLISTHFSAIGPDDTYASNYPPLVAFTSLPYMVFSEKEAYLVHVCLLILANIASIGLATLMIKDFIFSKLKLEKNLNILISLLLFFILNLFNFSSYFFDYSIERGNTDIFALFYSLLAVWILLKKPDKLWLQVLILSVAVHFKIYPAALFVLLFFKHGKKLILPAIIVNVGYLFILGPKIALKFIQTAMGGGAGVGIGNYWSSGLNHSAYSFTMFIDKSSDQFLSGTFFILWGIFTLIPLLLWFFALIALVKKKYSIENAILLLMVTIPMMDVVPSVSNDYRLVIQSSSVILLIGIILKQLFQKYTFFDLLQFLFLIVILLFMSRSWIPFDYKWFAIEDKYIWVVLLELQMVINIIKNQKPEYKIETTS